MRALNAALRTVVIRVARAYRTVSMEAALLLAAMVPADVLAEERGAVAVRTRTQQQNLQNTTHSIRTEERRASIER